MLETRDASGIVEVDATPRRLGGWTRRHRIDWVAGAVVLLAALVKSSVAYQGYFWSDDWQFQIETLNEGLTWERMFTQHGGHFMAGGYVVVWLLLNVGGLLPWTAAVATATGFFISAGAATWWALREVVGARVEALAALAVALLGGIAMTASTWMAEWLMLLPAWTCSAVSLALFARRVRTEHHAVAIDVALWTTLVAGLVFMEKAVFTPFVLFLVAVCWYTRGRLLPSLASALRRFWRLWLGYTAIVVAYTVVFIPRIDSIGIAPSPFATAHSMVALFVWALPSMLLSGPWAWTQTAGPVPLSLGPFWVQVAMLVAAIAGAAFVVATRRSALRLTVPLVAFLLMCAAAIQAARVSAFGWTAVMNFHYYSDGAALLACTAALWFLPLRGERDAHLTSPAARELLSRSRSTPGRIGAIALTGVLALGCLVSAQSYEGFWRDNPGRTFTDNYLRALRERPDTELFDGPPPVAFGFIFPPPPYVTRSQEFVVFPLQPRWVTHTSELFVLQQDGRIVPGVVRGIDVPVTSSVPCGTLVQGTTSIPVPGSPMRWSRTIYLDYLSKKASAVTLRFGDWSATVPVSAGLGRLYVATDGGGPSLQVTTEGIGDSLCIGRLVIGDQVPG